jgi:DNA repair protein RAD16
MQHLCYWNNEILTPIQKYAMSGAGEIAFKKLKILLDRMMLRWVCCGLQRDIACESYTSGFCRRTKIERADDLGLPPRTIVVRRDYFSPEEKELYLGLFSQTQRQFSTYVSTGTVLNSGVAFDNTRSGVA